MDREGNVALPFNSEGMYRAGAMPVMNPAPGSIVNKGQRVPHSEELDNREVLAVHQLNIAFQEERQFIPAVEIYRSHSTAAKRWRLWGVRLREIGHRAGADAPAGTDGRANQQRDASAPSQSSGH